MLHWLSAARTTTRLLAAKESGTDTLLGERDADEAIASKCRERER